MNSEFLFMIGHMIFGTKAWLITWGWDQAIFMHLALCRMALSLSFEGRTGFTFALVVYNSDF